MKKIVEDYFQNLFATENPSNFEKALEGLKKVISKELNDRLDMEFSSEEIKVVVFEMHPSKTSKPNGMHALFFQKLWDIVGSDVISFVKRLLKGSQDLAMTNKTCVVLLLKYNEPKQLAEFRHIAMSYIK